MMTDTAAENKTDIKQKAPAENRSRIPTTVFSAVLVCALVFADQWTKLLAVTHLKTKGAPLWLIRNVFSLRYVENRGIGFGLFQGRVSLILFFNLLILALILALLHRLPISRRMTPIRIVLLFTVSGALGNIIDRIRLGYVVDFLSFDLIRFPVFNMADIFVTVSIIVFALLYLFCLRTDELENAVGKNRRKSREEAEIQKTEEQSYK